MRVLRAAVAALVTWAALAASPAHAVGVLPCAGDEVGGSVVVRDTVVTVCLAVRADCPPGTFGRVVYLNGAPVAAVCPPDPGPVEVDPIALFDEVSARVLCPFFMQMAPGFPPLVHITPEGDVYVDGEWFWDCPPYELP